MNSPLKTSNTPGKAIKVNEYKLTIQALTEHRFLNRRQISRITRLEIPTLCRTLFNLVKRGSVKVSYRGKCPTTGKWVYYYSLTNQKGQSDGK